jgi:hypothetical protein
MGREPIYELTTDEEKEYWFIRHRATKVVLGRTNNQAFAEKIRHALEFEQAADEDKQARDFHRWARD